MSKVVTKAVPVAKKVSRTDFEYHMNGLRQSIGRTDTLADALQRYYDERTSAVPMPTSPSAAFPT